MGKKDAVPGVGIAIQTFGDVVNFHPPLHAIVSDGAVAANGWWPALPEINPVPGEARFRRQVFTRLRREGRIDETPITERLSWPRAGFSVHTQVRIGWSGSGGGNAGTGGRKAQTQP